jgi:hypothetical protein
MDVFLWALGIIVAIVVTHVYWQRPGKSLSFFLLVDDQPLSKVAAEVRDRLTIFFSYPVAPDTPSSQGPSSRPAYNIGSLHHIQVVIVNTGVKAITFLEAPIFEIPANAAILDALIIHQKPDDLEASLARLPVVAGENQLVRVALKMLNKGDLLVVKLLLSDSIDALELKLHLLAEDLPRNISIRAIPPASTKRWFQAADWRAVLFGILCLIGAAAIAALDTESLKSHPFPSLSSGIQQFISEFSMMQLETILSFFGVFMLTFLGAGIGFGLGLQPMLRRPRAILPPDLRPPG